ncbi:hypothetical protein BN1095_340217 [Clostridioides difficile]|uniref:Uncharacterized protein n=1 Tax=Clostridioides difficile TaxID=1496 RepID=A0A069ANT3_CLODI|nr:hypothetical protein BN1095_340217 [Clostridioides difficile]
MLLTNYVQDMKHCHDEEMFS